jgi:hypothetical protein
MPPMTRKPERKPKLTDAERFKRFHDMAREVEASDDPEDFDKAFTKVVRPDAKKKPSQKRASPNSPTVL